MKKLLSFQLFAWASILATCVSFNSFAQLAPIKQWDKTFGGSDSEIVRALQQTSDGGYIIGAWSSSGVTGDKSQNNKGLFDYWIVKTNALGAKVWDKSFGGTGMDQLWSLQQTSDGGYILGGHSVSGAGGDKTDPFKGDFDFWIIKLDANGNKVWDKTIGGSGFDRIRVIKQTPDGGYIIAGNSGSGISGDKTQPLKWGSDHWLVKLDASGTKVWDKSFSGVGVQQLRTLDLTSDGGFILGGQSMSGVGNDKSEPNRGDFDYWVIRTDGLGNKLWDKTYGGSGLEDLLSIDQTSDGGFILGGFSDSNISGDKSEASKGLADYWVVRLNAAGNKLWDKTFGGIEADELFSVHQTADGGFFLGGRSSSGVGVDKTENFNGYSGIWILKINAAGSKVWDKSFSGTDVDDFTSSQQTTDGGFILGGGSTSGIGGDKSESCRGAYDYWIIKTGAEILGTKETTNYEGYLFQQNQPNPFTESATFNFTLPKTGEVELVIYNSLGQTVGKLRKKFEAGNNQLQLEEVVPNENLKAGVYFCRFSAGKFKDTKRMMKL